MNFDLITVGRANMDLYAQQIGVPFDHVEGFDAMVGGSPTNIAIGTARLGLTSIAFTGVGEDQVGDFVVRYLDTEGVIIDHVARIPGKTTSLALLGVEPPDHFPLMFYRDDPADAHLTVDHAMALPLDDTRAIQFSGNALSRGTCAEATAWLAHEASDREMVAFVDLDLRPVEWEPRAKYGETLRAVLPLTDVVIGTEEEFYAALAPEPEPIMAGERVRGERHDELDRLVVDLLAGEGPETLVVKRGERGASVLSRDGAVDVPGYPVEVVNTVGAGDAFASGLIAKRLAGWGWLRTTRFANACGAIEVTRHGCASAFPTDDEVESFVSDHGGY